MAIRVIQPSFAGGELSPSLWGRVDLAKYQVGLKKARNCVIEAHGGVSNRAGLCFIAETKASANLSRLIPFQFNTTQAYILEFGNLKMRVIKDNGQVLQTAKNVGGITQASPGVVTITGHGYANGDEVFITGVGGMTALNGRNFRVANQTTNTFTLTDLYGTAIDTSSLPAWTSGGTAARVYEITTPYISADLADLRFVQSADVMWITHPSYEPRTLSRTGDASWALEIETYGAEIAAPAGLSVTTVNNSNEVTTYTYVVTAVDDDTGEESLASSSASDTGNAPSGWPVNMRIDLSWSSVAGADRYNIYKDDNGIFGFIGGTTGTSFTDTNFVADLSRTPPVDVEPFSGANNYPSCAAFFEQRLVYGATNNDPARLRGSQTANFDNFNKSRPALATDALDFTLVSRRVNRIRALVPMAQGLIAFTTDTEFVLDGGGNSDAITPGNIRIRPQGYRGSSKIEPLTVGDTVLFVQDKGSMVRDFGYQFAVDGYTGNDLTVMAGHLFRGHEIVAWGYAQSPDSIVWAVRDDGVLLSLTYLREHDVFAWSWHETDGEFEDVAVISRQGEDVPYFIVKRTVNGQTKRYIECLASRVFTDIEDAYFVDSGLSYDGSPATVISGLHHLEGEAVVALADGSVVRDLVVSDGAVTLPNAASVVHIGLSYQADVRTLSLDINTRETGNQQGRLKRVSSVVLRVEQTRGLFIGPSETKLVEWKQLNPEFWGDPIPPLTGDFPSQILPEWNRDGDLWISQPNPLPMTILAIMQEVTVNG